jgi:hypothetical protein
MQTSTPRFELVCHRRSASIVWAVLILLLQTANVWAQIGPRGVRPQPLGAGHSTVKGRVVYKDNLAPLKGVRLRIFTTGDDEGELIVFANDRGEFHVESLAAGKYYVALEGPGVAMPSGFGMRIPLPISAIPRAEDFGEIVPKHDAEFTVDGTNNAEVEIRVERGGKLAGKVLKPNGSPAADVPVSLLSRDTGTAGPYMARFSAQTGKDGSYRFENLPSGDYVVAAAVENKQNAMDVLARLRGESQLVTYHPAATTIRDALTVHVNPGGTVGGVNITLVTRESFVVSGVVVRQTDGTALAGATVVLRNKESELSGALVPGMGQRTTRTDAEGHWSFSNVAEGSYVVTALAPLARSMRPDEEPGDREEAYRRSRQRFLVAQQDVIVAGGNLNDLLLSITGSGSITGTAELDNGQALPQGLVIFLELVRDGGLPGLPLPVRVQPDGSFNFSDIQGGDVYLSAALPQGSTFFVKAITANGNDLRRVPLKVTEGTLAGPIRVILSTEFGRVTGLVQSDKNQPLGEVVVLLAPAESEKQQFRTSYFTTRTAADGAYSVSVAPGEYLVFARSRDQLPRIMSDEFIRNEAGNAIRVTVAAGEQKRLDLRGP